MKENAMRTKEYEQIRLARQAAQSAVFERLDKTVGKKATDELRALYAS